MAVKLESKNAIYHKQYAGFKGISRKCTQYLVQTQIRSVQRPPIWCMNFGFISHLSEFWQT